LGTPGVKDACYGIYLRFEERTINVERVNGGGEVGYSLYVKEEHSDFVEK
jgi:hypothetical protein